MLTFGNTLGKRILVTQENKLVEGNLKTERQVSINAGFPSGKLRHRREGKGHYPSPVAFERCPDANKIQAQSVGLTSNSRHLLSQKFCVELYLMMARLLYVSASSHLNVSASQHLDT